MKPNPDTQSNEDRPLQWPRNYGMTQFNKQVSNEDSQDELRAIRGAIGWANPQQRIDAVKRLIDDTEMNAYKRGFKEAEAMTQKAVTEARIDELHRLSTRRQHGMDYQDSLDALDDYKDDRIATLTNQPDRSKQ